MEVVVERNDFLKVLSLAQTVAERRNSMAILGHVLLECKDQRLRVSATDLDIGVVESMPARIINADRRVAIPAHLLHDIVRKLSAAQEISLKTEDHNLMISAGSSQFSIATLSGEDFPDIHDGKDYADKFSLKAHDLRALLTNVRFAMSTNETRYSLNGIFLHSVDFNGQKYLRAAATDVHRLACTQIPMPENGNLSNGVILSRKTVTELLKFLEGYDDSLDIYMSSFQACVHKDVGYLSTRLIDGTFPDYDGHIPSGNPYTLKINREAFIAAVDRVSLISFDNARAVKLNLDTNDLVLTSVDAHLGQAKEQVEANYGGPSLQIGFNGRYLIEAAQQFNKDEIEILFSDAGGPVLFIEEKLSNTFSVLMPMHV